MSRSTLTTVLATTATVVTLVIVGAALVVVSARNAASGERERARRDPVQWILDSWGRPVVPAEAGVKGTVAPRATTDSVVEHESESVRRPAVRGSETAVANRADAAAGGTSIEMAEDTERPASEDRQRVVR